MNPAFQEDSEEESEMRSGRHDSTLAAQRCAGLQAAATPRGEASCCPSLCNTGWPHIPVQPVPTGIPV